MRYRILVLFLALCVLCSGVALAGFGGSQEDSEDGVGETAGELPLPGSALGETTFGETATGPWASEPFSTSAYGEGYESGYGAEYSSPFDQTSPGSFSGDQAFATYPQELSPGFTAQTPGSPIGGYAPSYDSTYERTYGGAYGTYDRTVSAYYTTTPPPSTEQGALITYDVMRAPPASVYYRGTHVPWNTFSTTFPKSSPAFWVRTYSGWSWYASCPLFGWVQELMYIPRTGTLKVYEIYPSGQTKMYSYGWASPGYKYIWFYGDVPGRHIAIFTVSDKPSNAVVVDVV